MAAVVGLCAKVDKTNNWTGNASVTPALQLGVGYINIIALARSFLVSSCCCCCSISWLVLLSKPTYLPTFTLTYTAVTSALLHHLVWSRFDLTRSQVPIKIFILDHSLLIKIKCIKNFLFLKFLFIFIKFNETYFKLF